MKHRPRSIAMLGGVAAAILAAALLASGAHAQYRTGVIRVAPSGTDTPGCGSSAQPCRTAQYGLLQLNPQISGSWTGEVRLAAGTYTTSGDDQIVKVTTYGGNLRISGGYSTANWESSDPAANPTILDGQGARRGVLVSVPDAVAPGCSVAISNLTITNGRSSASDTYGGGILIDNCKAVSVTNVTIKDSKALGIDNANTSPLSPGAGGGIAVRGNSTTTAGLALQNVTIQNTQANGGNESSGARGGLGTGGGLYAIYSSVTAKNLTITGASVKGGDAPGRPGFGNPSNQRADGLGGAVALINSPSFSFDRLTISGATATGGSAGQLSGLALGAGMFIELSTGSITNSSIRGSQGIGANSNPSGGTGGAALGGGIFSTDSVVTMNAVDITHNTATGGTGATAGDAGGGGLYLTTGTPTVNSLTASNIIVAANGVSGSTGGGVLGGGIECAYSQMSVSHATIADNTLGGSGTKDASAIALVGFNDSQPCTGSLTSSIVANHAGTAISANPFVGNFAISNTLSNGNGTFVTNNFGRPVTVSGTISGSPAFLSAGNPNYNYHIGAGSAAIDQAAASSLATDIDAQPRPVGAGPDIGADEYQIALTSVVGNGTIALDWDAAPGATVTRYEVQYTKEAGASDASEGASPINAGTSTAQNLTGLTNSKSYTFTIVAYNGASVVARSAPLTTLIGRFPAFLPVIVR